MTTALDLDLATLVGELPDVACESLGHHAPGESDAHGGSATEYCRIDCPGCNTRAVKAYCAPLMAYIRANRILRCGVCSKIFTASTVATILGPVNGRAS